MQKRTPRKKCVCIWGGREDRGTKNSITAPSPLTTVDSSLSFFFPYYSAQNRIHNRITGVALKEKSATPSPSSSSFNSLLGSL